jgi:excinuclease ABC subunit A
MYILDEPSIGLHPRDTQQLIKVLEQLRDIGNTVVVVEHEEDIMRAADQLIDIGPDAGKLGGELVFQGHATDLDTTGRSHTARFLHHQEVLQLPVTRRKASGWLHLKGARENNLKQVDFSLPLGTLTAITGVSGSGKSTLIRQVFYPALARHFGVPVQEKGKFESLEGDLENIAGLEFVDQDPIGKSSRSNPVTYVKAYDHIRQLYADQALSQQRGYPAGYFSFNVPGGRCDNCEGEGQIKVEMQFMADIYLTCENCNGQRFKSEILDVEYNGKHIANLLELTVDEAVEFFADQKKIHNRLLPLQEVGLGYIKLGQSSNTLSGGEAQRVKLAAFLERGNTSAEKNILFIFDEPTTGLHFHDISKLLASFNALIVQGHSVLLIEHNMDVIAAADHVIDLGPGGGSAGGKITFAGTPEALAEQEGNYTGEFLAEKLAQLKKAQNGKAAKAKKIK